MKKLTAAKAEARTDVQAWLDRAHELRAGMYLADARYMLYLVEGETLDIWRAVDLLPKVDELLPPCSGTLCAVFIPVAARPRGGR